MKLFYFSQGTSEQAFDPGAYSRICSQESEAGALAVDIGPSYHIPKN